VEAMIRHQNDGGVFAGFLDQRPQHLIVVLVRHRDHVVVQLEVALPIQDCRGGWYFMNPWQK